MAKKVCEECGHEDGKRYNDPRDPPLKVTPCLCKECLTWVLEEMIDAKEAEIEELLDLYTRLTWKGG